MNDEEFSDDVAYVVVAMIVCIYLMGAALVLMDTAIILRNG